MATRPRSANGEAGENRLIESDDALAGAEESNHLGEVAFQRARPAEGVDAAAEPSGDQFLKTVHHSNAIIADRWDERSHACRERNESITATRE